MDCYPVCFIYSSRKEFINMRLKVIAFDADDTLWHNEHFYKDTEDKFVDLLIDFMPRHYISKELLKIEIQNLPLYGYGIKAFTLSMIETAISVSGNTIGGDDIEKIILYAKEMLNQPVEILDGVEEVLDRLQKKYRLVMATKGDLLDQERKLRKSGLEKYFHHIEIMSEKKVADYKKLINHLDITPECFAMVGNSLKSDILPVLEIGGYAFHIPYHVTWDHEVVKHKVEHKNLTQLNRLIEIVDHI
jgi:putative hydrolase of the HAD superfamily